MSYILANGCSWTNPNYGIQATNAYHTDEEKKELGIPNDNWPMWPEYVGKKFKLPVVNLGRSGASNEKIYKGTLSQILEKKPTAVFHMWSSNNRTDFFNKNINSLDMWNGLYLAHRIVNLEEDVYTEDLKYLGNNDFRLAWKLISIYYPHLFNDCVIYYSELHSNDSKIVQKIFANIRIIYVKQRHMNVYKSKDVKQSQDIHNDLLTWWVNYFINMTYWDEQMCQSQVDKMITKELFPHLATIHACNYYNIPYISVQGPVLGFRPKGNLDQKNNDIFQRALDGAMRIEDEIKKRWIDNSIFKEIDTLVLSGKAIIEGWPLHIEWDGKPSISYRIKNYKQISQKDGHPHWETQKDFGDFIYDLYKKNYT